MATSPGDAARKYGEITCDIPYITAVKQIESLLEYERKFLKPKNEKIDLILWTGDSISHDVHNTNQQHTLETINQLSLLIHNHFPTTPVIPTMGNHDFDPVNYFNTNYPNQKAL